MVEIRGEVSTHPPLATDTKVNDRFSIYENSENIEDKNGGF